MQKIKFKFTKPLKKTVFKVDKKCDVAYIKLAKQKYPTGGINIDNNILLNVEGKTGRVIGFTVINYSNFLKSAQQEREKIHNGVRESIERVVQSCERNYSLLLPQSLIKFTLCKDSFR